MFNEFIALKYDARNRVRGPMPRLTGMPTKVGTKQSQQSNQKPSKKKSSKAY